MPINATNTTNARQAYIWQFELPKPSTALWKTFLTKEAHDGIHRNLDDGYVGADDCQSRDDVAQALIQR